MTSRRQFGLTPREAEVLERIKHGEFIEEIASALNISPSTARHHYSSIHQKLELEKGTGVLQGIARKQFREQQPANAPAESLDAETVDKARERF